MNQRIDLFETIGCEACGKGEFNWKIQTDGQGNFRAICICGRITGPSNLRDVMQ